MDGVSANDTGAQQPIIQTSVESIAEVKILVSGYQAEFGRSSGIQISAITKSGSNQFRGAFYDIERNSSWNANSKVNILNGDPKTVAKQRDFGYSIGGPVGRPGGNNRLFFFYAQEYSPRTGGNDVVRFRVPTALERQGDFSQSLDQNGAVYNLIRDASTGLPCTAANTAGCFRDGGVVGRIPANRLYDVGLNILRMYPMPNTEVVGQPYNFQLTRPEEKLRSTQPVFRLDYQMTQGLRATFKYTGWRQQNETILGTVPGYNDSRQTNPVVYNMATTVNYSINSSTFLEAIYGRTQNDLMGCALAQGNAGTGPTFCRNGMPMSDISNRLSAGLGSLPLLFPDAMVVDQRYMSFERLEQVDPTIWDGRQMLLAPTFQWGNRVSNAPPEAPFGYLAFNRTQEFSASLTKVAGRHTIKTGYYHSHSFKAQHIGNWRGQLSFANDANNPLDSTFGFANAALGIFTSYTQSKQYLEGNIVFTNREAFVQDNWRVSDRLTLDYGLRFVNQGPTYDIYDQGTNWLQSRWSAARAPRLYIARCASGAISCAGTDRQAYDPVTNTLLGPGSAASIGTVVANTGSIENGLVRPGDGIPDTLYEWPKLMLAPRFGFAWDPNGEQRFVFRGATGLFYNRPNAAVCQACQNPPVNNTITVRNSQLQAFGSGVPIQAPPTLFILEDGAGPQTSFQWNGGVQMTLPWNSALDVEYVGQHSYNQPMAVNLNSIDFGTAYLPKNQDPTLGTSTTPGATAVVSDLMRPFPGFGNIGIQTDGPCGRFCGERTFHSLQFSITRRSARGVSLTFNDTVVLYDRQSAARRIQHNADGSVSVRDDQALADELLGSTIPQKNVMKANVVWQLPSRSGNTVLGRTIAALASDWQLAGVLTGVSGTAYDVGVSFPGGISNVNVTGSPDFGARVRIVGDPGNGCSADPIRQFNQEAFRGPLAGSLGLESGAGYLRGCFLTTVDLSIARNIRFGGSNNIQLRLDVFNALNAADPTTRNTTMQVAGLAEGAAITNLPYDAAGNPVASRSLPRNAGFGVATGYQNPRNLQLQIRWAF